MVILPRDREPQPRSVGLCAWTLVGNTGSIPRLLGSRARWIRCAVQSHFGSRGV